MNLDHVIRTSHRKADALSPGQQRKIAADFQRRTGHRIVMTHDSGRSESGKTMDRAALRDVRQRVRSGATDGVLVSYLDRLGRAPIEDSMTFVRELVGDGGNLLAADWSDDPIDLSDSNVEDMLVFRLQMNRSQWNKAAERQRLNKRDTLAAGKFIGPTPFGYEKKQGKLIPDPVWGPVVTRAYEIAARDGWAAVVAYLQEVAPNERIWRTDMVRKLLANRTYLGEHATRGLVGYGTAEGASPHEPLTDPKTFNLAQHAPRPRQTNGDYLLSNHVFCECGADLIGQHLRRADRGTEERRYRCQLGHATANAEQLDAYVRAELRELLADDEFRARIAPAGVEEARVKAQTLARKYRAFLENEDPEDAVFAEVKADRKLALDRATAAYDALVGQAEESERLPAADEMDDDRELLRCLRILTGRGFQARLRPSVRRAPLADRLTWHDTLDDGGGVLLP